MSLPSNPAPTPEQDWTAMGRADFDPSAPAALIEPEAVVRPVPAVPDAYGTEALFGDAPRPQRAAHRMPAPKPLPEADTLF
ncbi:hypothetical protein ACGFYQ_33805 [Streptomyces sp. NPDC048258]|uniref:hypothetical protein n=1 Tax=Streptomyces sp. NPDC048258 TaxID=3365527 RepID=UPI003722FE9F